MSSPKVQQLQLLQHNLQNMQMQKQQFDAQLIELNSAIEELESTDKAYKIIGKIMVACSKESLSKELEEKREVLNLHLKNLDKQEEKIKQSMENLQKEVVEEMKNKK